jgi:predicted Zn-dependent protease
MKTTKLLRLLSALVLCASTLFAVENTNNFIFTKADLELLEQVELVDQKYQKEGLVYHDEALNSYVSQVGLSMLPAGTAPEHVTWRFKVLRDPMPNAFALPNGSVYVTTGLLSLLNNEDQLASVLAHEITHVTDRHGYLATRDYRKKSAIISWVEFAGRMAPGNFNWGVAIQLAATLVPAIMNASMMGYARELEKNADVYSFNKLIEGNYDPREMPNTFRLLQERDEVDVRKVYYNDHPKLEDRIAYTKSLIQSKGPKPVPADVLAERQMKYQSLTEKVDREDIRLAILSHRARTAAARSTKLTDFHPNSADNLYCLAESYRALGPWTPRPSDQELSGSGEKEIESLKKKLLPNEQEREMLSKSSGQVAWQDNSRVAEDTYKKAIAADPIYAKTYEGLGQLYETEGRKKDAVSAYQKYLELNPNAMDQTMIRQRIETLQRSADL